MNTDEGRETKLVVDWIEEYGKGYFASTDW
jgi:hypothetical protein